MGPSVIQRLHDLRRDQIERRSDLRRNVVYKLIKFTEQDARGIPGTPFRIFQPVPLDRPSSRRPNNSWEFDPFLHTLFDYPLIVAHHLNDNGDPFEHFNCFLTVEVANCPFNCWHCYRATGEASGGLAYEDAKRSDFYEAREILEQFALVSKHHFSTRPVRVLRVSGGEPFLVPDLLAELLWFITDGRDEFREFKDYLPEFIWTETNQTPFAAIGPEPSFVEQIDKEREHEFREKYKSTVLGILQGYKDKFVIHPCFHGLTDDNLRKCTGWHNETTLTMEFLLNGFKKLHEYGFSLYPSFLPEACDSDGIADLFEQLYDIDPAYPLKTALVRIDCYPPTLERMRDRRKGDHNGFTIYSRFAGLWRWRSLIQKYYGVDYGQIPRPLANAVSQSYQKKAISKSEIQSLHHKSEPVLFIVKSTSRPEYRRELLTIIGAPCGTIIRETYDLNHIESSLRETLVEIAKGHECVLIYSERDSFVWLPIRKMKVRDVLLTTSIATFELELREYLLCGQSRPWTAEIMKEFSNRFHERVRKYFGQSIITKSAKEMAWVLLGEKWLLDDFQESQDQTLNDGWFDLLNTIHNWPKTGELWERDNIFVSLRLKTIRATDDRRKIVFPQQLEMCEGEELELRLTYSIPRFESYQQNGPAARPLESRTLLIETTTPRLVVDGYQPVPLAKYGIIDFMLRCDSLECDIPAQVTIRPADNSPFAPRFVLPLRLKKESASGC